MTKPKTNRTVKLLAVVAFAGAPLVARGGIAIESAATQEDGTAAPVAADPWAVPASGISVSVAASSLAQVIQIAVPRLMASGAPACGNVARRAPQPQRCERTEGEP